MQEQLTVAETGSGCGMLQCFSDQSILALTHLPWVTVILSSYTFDKLCLLTDFPFPGLLLLSWRVPEFLLDQLCCCFALIFIMCLVSVTPTSNAFAVLASTLLPFLLQAVPKVKGSCNSLLRFSMQTTYTLLNPQLPCFSPAQGSTSSSLQSQGPK